MCNVQFVAPEGGRVLSINLASPPLWPNKFIEGFCFACYDLNAVFCFKFIIPS